MNTLFIVIGAIYLLACNDAASLPNDEKKFTLRGRIILPGGPRKPIESEGKLTVELKDTSLADAPARMIARGTGQAIQFPMAFAVKYSSRQIEVGHTYTLHVAIRNKQNELLYINDVHIGVTPLGTERTKLIDVPVILVKTQKRISEKRQWPELVGENGQEAVRIIKQESGLTNVHTVGDGAMLTMDYRTDRVRVFVDQSGNVKSIPSAA